MENEKMVRKQIYLEPEQNENIKILSASKGTTEADIIREAIDRYLADNKENLDDPISQLVGMADINLPEGSITHDVDIYVRSDDKQ